MFSISVNPSKNRIYIELGRVVTGDGKAFYEEVQSQVGKLDKGFSCISDISSFSIDDPEEAVWSQKAIALLVEAGMARVVRVTGTETEFREFSEKQGYTVCLAATLEKAEQILDGV